MSLKADEKGMSKYEGKDEEDEKIDFHHEAKGGK
jgi:hypothetical protein